MVKQNIFTLIEGDTSKNRSAQIYETFMTGLIFLTVILIFLDTYETFATEHKLLLNLTNGVIIFVFTFDYIARVWTADLKYPELSIKKARMKYVLSGYGVVDALATFPPYFALVTTVNLTLLRLLRLARLFKMKSLSGSISLFGSVFRRKRVELLMVFSLVIVTIYISSILMFYAEHEAQPDSFTDAGASMWWAVITLTTIGYGDMYPVTHVGRMLGSVIAVLGIGVIALPTGILSGGLMEELNARKEKIETQKKQVNAKKKPNKCPHCGKELHD